jgi:CRP-like cAMP-binding protein
MLRSCSDAAIGELAPHVEPLQVDTGFVLMTEGDSDREAYLVVDGRASVLRAGRKVFAIGAGEFIGEMAKLSRKPRSATVVAATPMTLLALSPENFDAFTNHPAVSQHLTESLSLRVKKALEPTERR